MFVQVVLVLAFHLFLEYGLLWRRLSVAWFSLDLDRELVLAILELLSQDRNECFAGVCGKQLVFDLLLERGLVECGA